jgi:hypothetical protein
VVPVVGVAVEHEDQVGGLPALLEAGGDGTATEDAPGSFGQILSADGAGAAGLDAVRQDRFDILTHHTC